MERKYRDRENSRKIENKIKEYVGLGKAKEVDSVHNSVAGGYQSKRLTIYSVESPSIVAVNSFGSMRELGFYNDITLIGEEKNISELENLVGVKPEEK